MGGTRVAGACVRALVALLVVACTGGGGGAAALPPSTAHAPTNGSVAELALFDLSRYPSARCLDGSPSGMYLRRATTHAAASSFFVFLMGGGLCMTRGACLQRAQSDLGSSAQWSPTVDVDAYSFTSTDARNPFSDWNIAVVQYCSGDLHTGRVTRASSLAAAT